MTFEAVLYFLKRGSVGRSLTTFPLVILSCNALLLRIKAVNKLNPTLIIDSLLRFGLKYPCGERGLHYLYALLRCKSARYANFSKS